MSDEQIRDIFQNAEAWSPDEDDDGDFGDGGSTGGGPASTPVLPPLQVGSDVEIARCVAQLLRQERGEVIFSEGDFWYYTQSHWRPIGNYELRCVVHRYDGVSISGRQPVKLSKARIDSVLNEMAAMLERPDFFTEASLGINCASGFIAFAPDGTPRLRPHDPEDRCRHVIKGSWTDRSFADEELIFSALKSLDLLLARLLEGVFLGDLDAKEKRQLLAEIAGAAALGYGTKLLEPKAIIFEGKTAENGKSQVLDLFRGLLPSSAVASIPAAKMGDERFLVGLVGKHLNASDELSGAEAIASEVFKAVVTGEFVTGRDVYRSAIPFRSVAQNVFATNTLPSFKGGMDRGVQRRLLVLTFNRTIPAEQRVERIGQRISEEEADLLLAWAVAGASQLIRQRRSRYLLLAQPHCGSGCSAPIRCLRGSMRVLRSLIRSRPIGRRRRSRARMPTTRSVAGQSARDFARTHCRPATPSRVDFGRAAHRSLSSTQGTTISLGGLSSSPLKAGPTLRIFSKIGRGEADGGNAAFPHFQSIQQTRRPRQTQGPQTGPSTD